MTHDRGGGLFDRTPCYVDQRPAVLNAELPRHGNFGTYEFEVDVVCLDIGLAHGTQPGFAHLNQGFRIFCKPDDERPPAQNAQSQARVLSSRSVEVMNAFFAQHLDNPYPTEGSKRLLSRDLLRWAQDSPALALRTREGRPQ